MRITNSMMSDNLMRNLYNGMSKMDKYNAQLATNRRITRLSDDAIGVLNSMNARQRLYRVQQYQENVITARNWVEQSEVALQDISKNLVNIRETLTNAATDINNPADKKNFATLINEIKSHIMQSLNSSIGDKFLFAGYNTTKAPFSVDANGKVLYNGKDISNPAYMADRTPTARAVSDTTYATNIAWDPATPIGAQMTDKYYFTANTSKSMLTVKDSVGNFVGEVPYSAIDLTNGKLDLTGIGPTGSGGEGLGIVEWTPVAPLPTNPDDILKAQDEIAKALTDSFITTPSGEEIGQNIELEVGFNLKMQVSFTGIDVVGTGANNMFKILDDLVADLNNDAPVSQLTTYISKLEGLHEGVLNNLVTVGTRTNKVDSLDNRYSQDYISYEQMRADVEDIDPAQVIMQFKMSEAIYKQALATGARVIQPTLMDFLR